ncbi:hypothetical protein DRO59_01475 [Candidatus Bathyarchaeota archaeon]|nr:MAG: hypothetical protein DRO59_01475 [Candidatus Bathyarchaeota archaeon]
MGEREPLMIPGPTNVDPAVLRALSKPTPSHTDPEFVKTFKELLNNLKKVVNDLEKTAFFVTLPLALPIAVVKRFIKMVQGFNIPTGGVIVNGVIPEELVKSKKVTEYLTNKYKEQQEYMKTIKRDLWPMVRSVIPLYETEIVGVDMVERVAKDLVSWKPS